MKVLIVGFGSIGKRHLKNLQAIDPSFSVSVLRQQSKETEIGEYQSLVSEVFVRTIDAINWRPDAVFVCNPANLHMPTAKTFAQLGCHLFIEKPMAMKVEEIDPVIKECRKLGTVLMVGYVLRFFEPLKLFKGLIDQGRIGRVLAIRATVGRYLPEWRPGTDYRTNVSARKNLGGGVVFELSHELDYIRWLAGEIKEVSAVVHKVSDFPIQVEDLAEITVKFKNNAVGNIHLDMVDRAQNRSCRVIGSEGTLVWDSSPQPYTGFFDPGKKEWINLLPVPSLDYNQMFIDELRHFFTCVKKRQKPLVTGEDGQRVLKLALAAKESAKLGKTVKV